MLPSMVLFCIHSLVSHYCGQLLISLWMGLLFAILFVVFQRHQWPNVASSLPVAIAFSHRLLFPLAFNSQVIRRWWNGMLFFRLYHRNPSERMVRLVFMYFRIKCLWFLQPQLIGRARLPLRQVLRASQFCLDCELDIHSMNLQQAVDQTVEEKEDTAHKIGTIKVLAMNKILITMYTHSGSCWIVTFIWKSK